MPVTLQINTKYKINITIFFLVIIELYHNYYFGKQKNQSQAKLNNISILY